MSDAVLASPGRALLIGVVLACGLAAAPPRVAIERDPTRPPSFSGPASDASVLPDGSVVSPTPSTRLTTTVVAADTSFAVIDGVKVSDGDLVSGARVVRIAQAGVILHGDAGPYELRFHALPVKAAPRAGLAEAAVSSVKTPVRMSESAEADPRANASASAAELDEAAEPAAEEPASVPELYEGEDP